MEQGGAGFQQHVLREVTRTVVVRDKMPGRVQILYLYDSLDLRMVEEGQQFSDIVIHVLAFLVLDGVKQKTR